MYKVYSYEKVPGAIFGDAYRKRVWYTGTMNEACDIMRHEAAKQRLFDCMEVSHVQADAGKVQMVSASDSNVRRLRGCL